jgi:hypothetical protein
MKIHSEREHNARIKVCRSFIPTSMTPWKYAEQYGQIETTSANMTFKELDALSRQDEGPYEIPSAPTPPYARPTFS